MAMLMSLGKRINSLDILIVGITISNGIHKLASRDKDILDLAANFEAINY